VFGRIIVVAQQVRHHVCDVTTAIDEQWKKEGLRTPPLRWVSAQLLYAWVSIRRWSGGCSQNLHRPFLRAVRFEYLITYMAATLLVAGPTRTSWIPGQTLLASTSSYSSFVQRLPVGRQLMACSN